MPYYRRRNYARRNYRKKRQYRRKRNYRRKKNNPVTKKINLTTGIPDRMMTKLVYTSQYFLQDLVGGVGMLQSMRGNSIYDPDQTGTGGQPLGRDQWANFYNYYKVHGSKIEVTAFSLGTIGSDLQVLSVTPDITVPTTTINAIDIIQHPYSKHTYVGSSAGGSAIKKVSNYMSTKKLFGRTNLDDDDFKSLMSANPSDQFYWRIQAVPIDETSTTDLRIMVKMTYYVEFIERVTLQNS